MEKNIGKMILMLRAKQKLSQRELASLLNVSSGAVGMWETGKRQPDLNTVVKIANFFSVSVDYLLGINHSNGFECKNDKFSTEEELLLKLFNRCDNDCKKYLLAKAEVLSIEGISSVTTTEWGKYIDQGKKSCPSGGFIKKDFKKKA